MHTEYIFYPVGQGLFSSGHIITWTTERQEFNWMYDCGSSSSQALVESSLEYLARFGLRERRILDMVVLSHFDKDHISGITALLTKFAVDTLVIPMVPLWQRLGVVFSQDRYIEKRVLDFYIDPVSAITRIPGSNVTRIILVPPSRGDDGPPTVLPDNPVPLPLRSNRATTTVEMGLSASPPLTQAHVDTGIFPGTAPLVYELAVGGRLLVGVDYEFVPYNDAQRQEAVHAKFIAQANRNREALLGAASASRRKGALKALKALYESKYKSSKARNAISLQLYAGPTLDSATLRGPCGQYVSSTPHYQESCCCFDGGSVLYTGDAYLDTPKKWQQLAGYLGAPRTAHLLAFQVMHHGALPTGTGAWRERCNLISPCFPRSRITGN
jgi:hypothetical protein